MQIEVRKPDDEIYLVSPNTNKQVSIFLAGSIEMGKASDWQQEIIEEIKSMKQEGLIFINNPRRNKWDSSWVQSIDNKNFREQVNWELAHIMQSDIVFFWFEPGTLSPISLLELGLVMGTDQTKIVYAPEGYWRKGNIDVTMDFFVRQDHCLDDKDNAIALLKHSIKEKLK